MAFDSRTQAAFGLKFCLSGCRKTNIAIWNISIMKPQLKKCQSQEKVRHGAMLILIELQYIIAVLNQSSVGIS